MSVINIIEPSLRDQAGHCYGYVDSLLHACDQLALPVKIWADHKAKPLFSDEVLRPYFHYRLRKWQTYFLYKRLLRQQAIIFIPTASGMDLFLLDKALRKNSSEQKIFLHFHQFRQTPKKLAMLKKMAEQYPEWVVMTPTERLREVFHRAGFIHCEYVPCPTYAAFPSPTNAVFDEIKILYVGAARADKGFPQVVNFVEYCAKQGAKFPISIQVSPPHSGSFDKATKAAVNRLTRCAYAHLTLQGKTLDQKEYLQQFFGGICLLIYDPLSYRDKFSGVTLDALYSGCPVITVPDTWMGQTVTRFQAGLTVADREPQTIYQAVMTIMKDYAFYHRNAMNAGIELERAHRPEVTLEVIQSYL